MKKQLLILFSLLTLAFLQGKSQTMKFNDFDGKSSFGFNKVIISGCDYGQGVPSTTVTNEYREPAPSCGELISEIYSKQAVEEYNNALRAWEKRDWNKAKKFFKAAGAYCGNKKYYDSWILHASGLNEWDKGVDAQNKGSYDKAIMFYKEAMKYFTDDKIIQELKDNIRECYFYKAWDEGVKEAKAGHWDAAIAKFKEALKYHPDNETLKANIVVCSFKKTKELAEKFRKEGDWVEAGVYYNILLKNFDDHSYQSEYSQCLSEISAMNHYDKFNSRLSEEKQKLPYINSEWGN